MNKSPSRGRRAGSPDTGNQILAAAKRRFLAVGYQATTLRSIAAEAGVDVALVSYYFGSKQSLFGAAMALPANPIQIIVPLLAGDPDTLAEALLRSLLQTWDDPTTGAPLQALAQAAVSDPDLNRAVREAVSREVVGRLTKRLGGPDSAQQAAAFSAQMAGVIIARYVIRLEPFASMSAEDVVRRLGPSLALTITPAKQNQSRSRGRGRAAAASPNS
jgi:AcrR family transcriptional regulator